MDETTIKSGVVIVAAGRGSRAGSAEGPKQYRYLGGKSVLARTLLAFDRHPGIDGIVVVTHQDDEALFDASIPVISKLLCRVPGGVTRQQSVAAGLQALLDFNPDTVLIHDAARPFVDEVTISRVLGALASHDAVLPALAVTDTLRRVDDRSLVAGTVSREGIFAAQTPQGFRFKKIHQAHLAAVLADQNAFTDDSSLAEWAQLDVAVVEGAARNTKLTTREDMKQAREIFNMTVPDIRVGHGYDTHEFAVGNTIWLCGVALPHSHSLSGHSDADVGLHALTDALLATIADGDIGSHFPPDDPTWRGARSDQFLRHAVSRVEGSGGRITHMDVTLICEAPKVGPHRDAMRSAISSICNTDVARISVKATTNERMGFIGRNEGMVALATATVVMEPGND
jgi:2-C-methyl-D-erythritol 4-phosphate cytidylyltransferase/2-C-methyl-D-erythritol 2,4-cyclodiphosphate synthase